jgi:lyso-ornithine lipid O-acyltransferase
METGSSALGTVRLAIYGAVTVIGIPFQALFVALKLNRVSAVFPVLYHRLCCRILGIRINVVGQRSAVTPTLYIANHSSYLDIPVLGTLVPGSFIAKSEVGSWPLFGLLAKLQRTVFVDRAARTKTHEQRDSIAGRLQAGGNLVLFPEGTSSDGNRTLPFKTALFSVASTRIGDSQLTVQPVSIAATHLDGMPLGHHWRSLYAWFGDMELPPHLWRLVQAGKLDVTVEFHEPVTLAQFSSRKALADFCWKRVAAGVDRAVAGRNAVPAIVELTAGSGADPTPLAALG